MDQSQVREEGMLNILREQQYGLQEDEVQGCPVAGDKTQFHLAGSWSDVGCLPLKFHNKTKKPEMDLVYDGSTFFTMRYHGNIYQICIMFFYTLLCFLYLSISH